MLTEASESGYGFWMDAIKMMMNGHQTWMGGKMSRVNLTGRPLLRKLNIISLQNRHDHKKGYSTGKHNYFEKIHPRS